MKSIIYLRTSTKDQNPELQRQACIDFAKQLDLEIEEVISEQGSAYRIEKVRPLWEETIKKAKNNKLNIILWKYDRAFRNREEFYKFMKIMFEVYEVKIYSATEPSILSFWSMLDKKYSDNPIFNEFFKGVLQAFWNFMIQQAGEQAEEESRKKSERVKLAVRSEGGITTSYKGNKWGRRPLKKIDEQIIELYKQGKKMREITEQVYYWDKNNHKKFVSLGYVHKSLNINNQLNEEKSAAENLKEISEDLTNL